MSILTTGERGLSGTCLLATTWGFIFLRIDLAPGDVGTLPDWALNGFLVEAFDNNLEAFGDTADAGIVFFFGTLAGRDGFGFGSGCLGAGGA